MRGVAAAIAATAALCACETTVTTADGTPPAPKPTAPTAAPAGAMPNAIAITFAPKPADTNGNLLPDSLQVTAYLFSRPHPTPIFHDGEFHFAIFRAGEAGSAERPGAEPLRAWTMSREGVRFARSMALAGPCHEFTLSLLANGGTDDLPVESVDLVSWFVTAEGEQVWMRGVRGVQFAKPQR
ncbi:MAG: hypothetical protein ACKOYN_04620 [Planctomycetota bacterium]